MFFPMKCREKISSTSQKDLGVRQVEDFFGRLPWYPKQMQVKSMGKIW
jgi:hypothetical protein